MTGVQRRERVTFVLEMRALAVLVNLLLVGILAGFVSLMESSCDESSCLPNLGFLIRLVVRMVPSGIVILEFLLVVLLLSLAQQCPCWWLLTRGIAIARGSVTRLRTMLILGLGFVALR